MMTIIANFDRLFGLKELKFRFSVYKGSRGLSGNCLKAPFFYVFCCWCFMPAPFFWLLIDFGKRRAGESPEKGGFSGESS